MLKKNTLFAFPRNPLRRLLASMGLLLFSSACMAQTPVMRWDFETIRDGAVIEAGSAISDTVEGNFEAAPGVVGKGLRLDGFTTRLVRQTEKVVKPGAAFTVEAWVALGGYPLNWCPLLTTESNEVKGYRLLIGPYGQVSFETAIAEQWVACTSTNGTMPLRAWRHLVGVYEEAKGLTLYVDGEAVSTVSIASPLTMPVKPRCVIGMVSAPRRPSDTIRTWGTLEGYYGLDGILDEIRVFDTALTAEQIIASFRRQTPKPPAIEPRRLPTIPATPGRFGAYYTKLAYYPGWDDLWPVDQDPDIVVCFDKSPVKLIFWRGIRYGACWVSENENWMTDQSLETWDDEGDDAAGCYEHMQDPHCRFSHVRIIENTDARAVVHWRYALISARGSTWMPDPKTGWECWVDEYYTIYPDGSAVRKVSWNKGSTGPVLQYQESLPVTQPGQRAEELLEQDYVRVADYDGHARAVSRDMRQQPADWQKSYTVQQFNFKSANKPFICFEPGNDMTVRWIGGGYNHFPVNQAYCDGRWARTLDRPTHIMSSPCSDPVIHEKSGRLFWNGLYGMNVMSMTELVSFGRSWAYPAELSLSGTAFSSQGYDRSQRCYQLVNNKPGSGPLEISLHGSKESPLVNPAIRIKNWNADTAKVLVNGKPSDEVRLGFNHGLEGTDLTLFVLANIAEPLKITVKTNGMETK